ncbi:DNA-binding protein [Pantoea vagans]|uniref:DNA-binding protein n=1 Tax=Pantoea vagans TaxID=470934 RepID=UPI0023B1C936|nr:DNA-binding protein [Pantoea vagans]MDE8558843.1 DNA-binding protein [Pantoea vagans]MDE8578848.1 DNA-binding protein [Pantoea vagans]
MLKKLKVILFIAKAVGFLKVGEDYMNSISNSKEFKNVSYSKNLANFIKEMEGDFYIENNKMTWNTITWSGYYNFYKYDFAKGKRNCIPLDFDFILFAKAYIKHLHFHGRRKDYNLRMSVLKILESVLLSESKSAKLYNCSNYIFDKCVEVFTQIYSEITAYQAGKELKEIEKFLRETNLADLGYVHWINPLRMPAYEVKCYDHNLAGHDKLPDISFLVELAKVFSQDDKELSTRDMFTSSVLALLMCAPSRISEILSLPADCEVWETDSKGYEKYGLRFFSAKGYEGDVKWIPSLMVPVARKAIARLKSLSKSARELAKNLESSVVYRNSLNNDISANCKLTVEQVCIVLGLNCLPNSSIEKKLSSLNFNHNDYSYSLNSLNNVLRERVPDNFPWYDSKRRIKYSNALCSLSGFEFQGLFKANKKMLIKPTKSCIYTDIKNGKIFPRLKKQGDSMSCFKTHSLRHFLNTLAQIAGMSEFDLARWSGRQCIAQNSVYNHTPHAHMVAQAVKVKALEKIGDAIPIKMIFEKEFDEDKEINGSTSVSKYGVCRLKYAMQPCKYYPANDSGSEIEEISDLQKRIYSIAESDFKKGNQGAEKWKIFHDKIINKGE